jgi:hypothetical protein
MPYFTKARIRANCARGISRVVCGSALIGALTSASRTDGAGKVPSTRGLRAGCPADGRGSESDGSATCRFGVKSASAA